MAEGFLEILGITAPESAAEGSETEITIHLKNTGGTGSFKIQMSDLNYLSEFNLIGGYEKDITISFIMPNQDVSATINAYHWESEVGWVWDAMSVWEILFPFMSIQ